MKNKNFFYLQYNKINWPKQEKTKINSFVNNYIIKKIISKKKGQIVKIFDIGFGIGFFIKMLHKALAPVYQKIIIEGCEPSEKNYRYFIKKQPSKKNLRLKTYKTTFLNVKTEEKFDFITAIYVFPHFLIEEFKNTAKKINSMLKPDGQFILVVANQAYLEEKLKSMKDLFIERNFVEFDGKKYKEILHYSDIPEIGKVIDYNREDQFYFDLFKKYDFKLVRKKTLNDNGFICTVFTFQKMTKQ